MALAFAACSVLAFRALPIVSAPVGEPSLTPRALAAARAVKQLEADIRTFIDRHNENPKPFKWVKSADQILASVKRF